MTVSTAVKAFDFECRGVRLRITGNNQELVDWASDVAGKALLGDVHPLDKNPASFASVFEIDVDDCGVIRLTQDERLEGENRDREMFRRHLNSLVRVAVAENVPDRLFLHAGAVAWKGKGIIFPGDSYVGKSTVVAELIRNGADYLSDDYAIFDQEGRLYAFPRPLTIRADGPGREPQELHPEDFGAQTLDGPLTVSVVCMTSYESDFDWSPVFLTPGQAVLEMVPFTFSFVNRPEFSLEVLNKIAERAIIISSKRGVPPILLRKVFSISLTNWTIKLELSY
jgi:hypothetical protein